MPRILNIEKGSVRITIEITIAEAERLVSLQQSGMLSQLGIKGIAIIGDIAAAAVVANKRVDGSYDVMCHNADDEREVKRIGIKLRAKAILPWVDEWELRPGQAGKKTGKSNR